MLASSSLLANGKGASIVTRAKIERLSQVDVESALPIRIAQSCSTIEGRQTHVITQHYADRILVIVTQLGKIGALTQVTTHKRPSLPRMYDDDFLNDDVDAVELHQEQDPTSGYDNMNDATTSQALFGTPPTGQETLYEFYKQQISSLIQADIGSIDSGLESKPVIIGLSLALPSTTQSSANTEDDEQGDFAQLADTERLRFRAVLDLVRQARTW